jgi:EAL domain-containing protein (putative c-di-GMP-specific phosphodiesterase class I)
MKRIVGDNTLQVLVIDDESDFGEFICEVVTIMNCNCIITTNAADFMKALNPEISLIILDLMMPDIDGIELLRLLKQKNCKSKIILMSGVDKRVLEIAENLAKSLDLFVIGRLQKPFRKVELERILNGVDFFASLYGTTPISLDIKPPPIKITNEMLLSAFKQDEFVVYYQPQIEIASGRISGVEALVRWQHPEQGLIFPDMFIAKIEALGMGDQLGWLVTNKALSNIKNICDKNGATITISINISPYSLQNLKFPDILIGLAKKFNVKPMNIIIEITESGLFKKLSSALDILTRLRMKQVKLSIDDFGTGYAMMQQLRNIPATELKIDKSFIQDIDLQESARIMVLKIIEIGHELGMKVLAEGVESEEQLEFLRVNQCDLAQGFFFSKPLPLSELLDWVDTS